MEIRDVIPSQNQVAMKQKPEAPNQRFKELMNRKFENVNQRQETEQSYERREAQTPETATKIHHRPERIVVRETERVAESTEITAEAVESEEGLPEDIVIEELAEITIPSEKIEIPDLSAMPGAVSVNPMPAAEPPVEINASVKDIVQAAEGMPESAVEFPRTEVPPTMKTMTNRVNLREAYRGSDVNPEAEYVKMLEILASDTTNTAEKLPEASISVSTDLPENEGRVESLPVEADIPSESELPKQSVKNDTVTKSEEEVKPLKVEIARDEKMIREPKEKNHENSHSSNHPLFTKTESVRHHDNMVSMAPRTVMKQVAEAIVADVKVLSDGQALEVKLNPEHLGKVVMKIEMKEGQMVANIKVDNPEVKSALEASMQELRETLSSRGVTVKEIHVGVSKDEHRGGQEYTGNHRKKEQDDEESKDFLTVLTGEES